MVGDSIADIGAGLAADQRRRARTGKVDPLTLPERPRAVFENFAAFADSLS